MDNLSASVNVAAFGLSAFDRVYELETPAATEFSFTLVARGADNQGTTRLSISHVADNGVQPAAGVESMAASGLRLDGSGLSNEGSRLDVTGDGFSRITISGSVSAEQVLLISSPMSGGTLNIGLRIRIGNVSDINLPNLTIPGQRPGMTSTTIYSSESWYFGLPAIAVSGDRYSVVAYDGDTAGVYGQRMRRWLQMDATTSMVTGGEAASVSKDTGNWRDQEVAALGNVLGVVYTGNNEVRADISLDRGATFPIQHVLQTGLKAGLRLVQMAISADYQLACIYWGNDSTQQTARLMLVEATPTAFDINNTPIDYTWSAPEILYDANGDATPVLMHAEYSTGGDLVVGYGYTRARPTWWEANYRCAVRLWGQSTFATTIVDSATRTAPTSADPHVSLLGTGASMEIFFAWDRADGAHLAYSTDAGQTFATVHSIPVRGAFMPTVHARMVGANKRVDMLYLLPTQWGLELHNAHWDDFTPAAAPTTYAITTASYTPGAPAPYSSLPPGYWLRMVGWFGYDAVLKGDEVAIAVHELTVDSYEYYRRAGRFLCPLRASSGGGGGGGWGGGGGGGYTPPPPPKVLLPGLTDPVPTPDPNHRSLLTIIVID
ncbi:MAG: hypothetical protein K8I27_11880 [Planctomycetes bacterium]|nr:hypothetical protein [Planctomycetota bacterium]